MRPVTGFSGRSNRLMNDKTSAEADSMATNYD